MIRTEIRPPMPDLPDTCHGIKSINPCMVQCDGCGRTDIGDRIAFTIIQSPIRFRTIVDGGKRRMCPGCWDTNSEDDPQ